jgi:hypothetical protein
MHKGERALGVLIQYLLLDMMWRAAAGHSTIIDAYMSLAILADDRARYDKAVDLFHKTGTNFTA